MIIIIEWVWHFTNDNHALWMYFIGQKYDMGNGGWSSNDFF